MGWHDGWGWGFGFLPMVLFWGVLIVLILLLAKWLFGPLPGTGWTRGGRALDVLKERYARGEIGKDEFEQKKRDLES